MKTRQKIADTEEIAPNEVVGAVLENGQSIAVYNIDGHFYATSDRCTHGNSSLSEEGFLEGHEIECGMHGGSFDVRTGCPLRAPCTIALRIFDVEVDEGAVWVLFDDPTKADQSQQQSE